MSKTQTHDVPGLSALLKTNKGETLPFRQIFDLVARTVAFNEAIVTSTMPRGGLQIAQPMRVPEMMVKTYSREFNAEDRITWQTISRNKALRGREAYTGNGFDSSRYFREFVQPSGFQYVAAVPLKAPVFRGYPGAIQFFRSSEQGDFTDADLAVLADLAKQLDEAIVHVRAARQPADCTPGAVWSHEPSCFQFILDQNLKSVFPWSDLSALDDRVRQQMLQHARHRLDTIGEEEGVDRLQLPDQRGDLWTFRVTILQKYPAFGDGNYVIFAMQPEAYDWAVLRPSDLAADQEVSRLVPAVRFMQQEFHRSPTLGEISKQVHLSPFHFHRRFSELMGLTPKHFLLECQIYESKRQLAAREKELADIATDCGFAHQSHFTSRFKQATGLTPTRWRRVADSLASKEY